MYNSDADRRGGARRQRCHATPRMVRRRCSLALRLGAAPDCASMQPRARGRGKGCRRSRSADGTACPAASPCGGGAGWCRCRTHTLRGVHREGCRCRARQEASHLPAHARGQRQRLRLALCGGGVGGAFGTLPRAALRRAATAASCGRDGTSS